MGKWEGGCGCGNVRYRLLDEPIIVHCCHCTSCQRETGSAFAMNALIESDRVETLSGTVEKVSVPSDSGRGHVFARCPDCLTPVWSHYGGLGELMSFITVGSLDHPDEAPPDVHIFTRSKQDWVALNDDIPAFEVYYDRKDVYSPVSLERFEALLARR